MTEVEQNNLIAAETMRLMRAGVVGEKGSAPLDGGVPLLDLISFARSHLVLWPVTQGLLKACAGQSSERAILKVVSGISAAANKHARQTADQLAELVISLSALGQSPIFLKGAAFIIDADMAPQPWRPMCDLDFLCARDSLPTVIRLARELGYVASSTRFSDRHDVHYPMLIRPSDDIGLEAHVKLSWAKLPAEFGIAIFDREARTVEAGNMRARIPSDMHRLAHLVVHAQISSHRFDRFQIVLRDLLDWYHLAGRRSVDLDKLDRLFSAAGFRSHFRSFAAFCENYWFPGNERLSWYGSDDQARWRDAALAALSDEKFRNRAILYNWIRMAGRSLVSPREASRLIRSLAENRRPQQCLDLIRGLFG